MNFIRFFACGIASLILAFLTLWMGAWWAGWMLRGLA